MLSTDIQTEFRDKATNISVYPLSFEEFKGYSNHDDYNAVNDYMIYGNATCSVKRRK